ncbi:WPP domain-interacting protein 1 [Forsythia ovata]|uniref:WPP domain-interacting protein 1 n=1 Tax=Forsythia ovata TaxID=205694 RepID=A0ABD1R6V0_9LAMI
MQGNDTATSNGILCGRLMNYDEENGDEVQGGEREVCNGLRGGYDRSNGGGFEDVSHEDLVADSSRESKKERSENHENSTDSDPLVESIFALQSAQEALEKEVQMFREIGREDVSVDDLVRDLPSEITSVDPKLYETSSTEQLHSCKRVHSSFLSFQSEVKETGNTDMDIEFEDLFKQKIESEVEYMVISRNVQELRVAAVDHITLLEEQKTVSLQQTRMQ